MALTDDGTGTTMLVQPAGGFGYGGNGGGDFMGGSGWWILLLFILLGGWNGNNGYGGMGGGMGGGLYPWMNQSNQINDGFQNQMLNSGKVSQAQYNQAVQTAQQLARMIGIK